MTEFIQHTVRTIDERLQEAYDELERLQSARSALAPSNGTTKVAPKPAAPAAAKPSRSERKRSTTQLTPKQVQALELIKVKPGITAAELSRAMPGGTYGYAVVKRLREVGEIEPCEKGWQAR